MNQVEKRVAAVIGIIYLVGLIGYLIPNLNSWVLPLTAINISAVFIVALLFHKKWNLAMVLGLFFCGIAGFSIEVAGVKTGWIFGNYTYGKTLGTLFWEVPWILAVNWAALIFYTSNISQKWFKNVWASSFSAAFMMVVFDYILEPVAIKYDYWSWHSDIIPFKNYLAWFIVSFFLHITWFYANKPAFNRLAAFIFICQSLFFLILHIFLVAGIW